MPLTREDDPLFIQVQERLTPLTLGILWSGQEVISEREPPFDELNYFFNGILEKNTFQRERPDQPHLFVSTHYGRPVFLGQVKADSPQLKKILNQFLKIMKGRSYERNQILVITKNLQNFPSKSLKKSHPSLKFDYLFC